MLPNSVVFSLIIIFAFFPMVSLCKKAVAFFPILYLGSKVVKWLSQSLSRSHCCTRYQNHVCIPGLCLSPCSFSHLQQLQPSPAATCVLMLSLLCLFLHVHPATDQLLFHIQVHFWVSWPGSPQNKSPIGGDSPTQQGLEAIGANLALWLDPWPSLI